MKEYENVTVQAKNILDKDRKHKDVKMVSNKKNVRNPMGKFEKTPLREKK